MPNHGWSCHDLALCVQEVLLPLLLLLGQGASPRSHGLHQDRLKYTLHCTALHCIVLHCTALHCTVLYFSELHCTALYCCQQTNKACPHCPQ